MAMRDDFCAFILTHGRPDRVRTYDTLMKAGYTGKVYIVIDDEDKTEAEYRKRFGDKVLQFCKAEWAEKTDEGDNFQHRKAIVYARNACWDLARQVGCRYFVQFDDDYTELKFRFDATGAYRYTIFRKSCDGVFDSLVEFLRKTNAMTIAMSQGGDFIGGGGCVRLKRKAMNSWFCDTEREFRFFGHMNEDVSAYVTYGRRGGLFCTTTQVQLDQKQTQAADGGMSGLYLSSGTYVKSFYTVMAAPSCVAVGVLGDPRSMNFRIHHKINWHNTAPKILDEQYQKPR